MCISTSVVDIEHVSGTQIMTVGVQNRRAVHDFCCCCWRGVGWQPTCSIFSRSRLYESYNSPLLQNVFLGSGPNFCFLFGSANIAMLLEEVNDMVQTFSLVPENPMKMRVLTKLWFLHYFGFTHVLSSKLFFFLNNRIQHVSYLKSECEYQCVG